MNKNKNNEKPPAYLDADDLEKLQRLERADAAYREKFGKMTNNLPLGWAKIAALENAVETGNEIPDTEGI